LSGADVVEIERNVRQAIWDFEPRILPDSLRIKVTAANDQMNQNAMSFEIEGQLWAQPLPLHLFIRSVLDLETGEVTVNDLG
jgi:type VI secretion system protein ImpF